MNTPQISLSSFDYLVLSRELGSELSCSWVDNVYHHPGYGYYLLSLRSSGVVKKLIIMPGESLFLTRFNYPVPSAPGQGLTKLRKLVCNLRVENVEQHGFDRIVSISFSRGGFKARLIVECLKRGVMVLVSEEGRILFTSKRLETSTRFIRNGEKYVAPPSNIVDPREDAEKIIEDLKGFSSENAGRFIAGRMGFGSKIMREICERAGIDSDSETGGKIPVIIEAARTLLRETLEEPEPRVYYSNGVAMEVSGVRLYCLKDFEQKEFNSLSEALDEYYAVRGFEEPAEGEKPSKELDKLLKVRERLASEVEVSREKARTVMDNLLEFQSILDAVRERRLKPDGKTILKVDYSKRIVKIFLNNVEFTLEFDKTAAANASKMFEEAKKVEKHLVEIDRKIVLLKGSIPVKGKMVPKEGVERKWYEKFRWDTSVRGNLILVGKDAGTNELLVKKYVNDRSIVLHADFTGAPFVTIYNVEEASEEELEEAALMAACYTTKAWENKYASLDVYWVRGSQVTKQAPSGQYLPKGAFMIRGEKSFIRNVELRLWIGVTENWDVVYGSLRKVRERCMRYACIVPGEGENSREATRLVEKLFKNHELQRGELAKLRETIRSIIPGRHCEIQYVPST